MRLLRLLLVCLLLLYGTMLQAQVGPLLQKPYQPPVRKESVRFFLEDMVSRTGVQISYSDELVKRRRSIRLKGTEKTIGEVLETILAGTGVSSTERGEKILLIAEAARASQPMQYRTVSGFVRDSSSREVLAGAAVYIPAQNTGAVTNAYGFYSMTVPAGRYRMVTASAAYHPDTSSIDLSRDARIDVLLSFGLQLTGVIVSSKKEEPADHTRLTMKDIRSHTGLFGENDLLRALQYLPGVQCGPDGLSTVLVRGGDPGQNLALLDGVPIYYVDHFYGLTSVFNTDAIKSVDFYKSAFPARYGGRISSIIDVSSRDGNMERITGQASLGLIKGNLTLEGPIVREKASFMLSARRTWIDVLWRPFLDDFAVDFYDINGKVNYIINKNNRVYASLYTGRDQFGLTSADQVTRWRCGNTVGAVRWTSVINPKLFISTTGTYSYFRYETTDKDPADRIDSTGVIPEYTGRSTINEAALRIQADYNLSSRHQLQGGMQYSGTTFAPASIRYNEDAPRPLLNALSADRFSTGEIVLYGEDTWKFAPRWQLRGGLHLANWISSRFSYSSLQPRLYLSWKPTSTQSISASVARMAQYLHLLTNNGVGISADFFVPSTGSLKPERSWQYTMGYALKVRRHFEGGIELYYKDVADLVSYKSGNNIFNNSRQWEDKLTQGRGWGYGAECYVREQLGPFTASVAYTLSWTWRQFDLLNGGDPFPYRYDRRHNLKSEIFFQTGKRFSATASWTYMSGEAFTLPDQAYPDFDNSLLGIDNTALTYNYDARNNYRLPQTHRLDVAFNFMRQRGKRFERTWTLGLFNAYGRRNVLGVTLKEETRGIYVLSGISVFRFIPTISYAVRF